jgi:hypothetical protein
MYATEHDDFPRARNVDQIIGEASKHRPSYSAAYLGMEFRALKHGSDAGVDCVEELGAESRAPVVIPLRGFFDLPPRLGPNNKAAFRSGAHPNRARR